mgnify:CR=1 FL=1
MSFKQVNLDNINIKYKEYKSVNAEKTLVILHGWNVNGIQSWEKFLDKLTKSKPNYNWIAIDMPGFGGSDLPNGVWGPDEYSDFIHKLLTVKLKLNQINLIVHSFG